MIITHFQLHFQIKSELRMSIKTKKQTSFLKYNMNAELKAILETYRVFFCFHVSITPLETKKLQAWRVDQRKMHHVQRLHEKVRSQGLHVCPSTPFPTQLSLSPILMPPNSSVSVSGGVDSAVTLGLMKYAMSMPDSPIKKILGIAQPIKSSQWALDRALECGKNMDVEIMIVDQTDIYNQLVCSQSRLSHQS